MEALTVQAFLALPMRERDAYVARKVLGWSRMNDAAGSWFAPETGYVADETGSNPMPYPFTSDESTVFNYIVPEMRRRGMRFTLQMHELAGWVAVFGSEIRTSYASNPALAICLAALVAVKGVYF